MSVKSEDDFIELVKKSEQDAATNPRLYITKLALFAVLGYVVIFAVLTALLGLAGGLVASAFFSTTLFLLLLKKKLIFAVLIGAWLLFRALWVKFTPPQGYTLKRGEYPELFDELDALSKQLNALKIHEVILDSELNAAVVQHPRLGVLGWHKNYLIIGYPLLLTLSPDEMRSVLAHEFGHLSGNHSRFNGWIYRVRLIWMRVMAAFDQVDSWSAALMRRFFDWYSPQFEAYSFALARNNEYEADAIAAELTSPEVATRALVNVYATAPYLDESYWNNYFRAADDYPKPKQAPFAGLADFLNGNPLGKDEMLERIKKEMIVDTHYTDTHPSLKDRVMALGAATPQIPESPGISAADAWLGAGNQKIMADFDQQWLTENGESWSERYEYVKNARDQLERYSQMNPSDLNDQELWDYAFWTNEFDSGEASLPLFEAYKERHPQDNDSAFFIGQILLGQGNASGLEQLRLASNNPALIEGAAHTGYNFLMEQGKEAEAEAWWQESLKLNEMHMAAQWEHENVDINDELRRPEIDDELLQQIISNLRDQKNAGKAWLAQKVVKYYPESPVYIIAFKPSGFYFSYENVQSKVAESLNVDASLFVVCKYGNASALAKKVIKAGERIL